MKRTYKFYRKNEQDVMRDLGLDPTPNSGSGSIIKEDGVSESVICQLKSTDKESMRILHEDFRKLEYNASVCHKLPVFAIQFLQSNSVYIMVKPEDLMKVAESFAEHGVRMVADENLKEPEIEVQQIRKVRTIKSSSNKREEFHENIKRKNDKTKYL